MNVHGDRRRVVGTVLVGVFASLVLLVVLVPEVYSQLLANIDRVRALRGLELPVHERSLDEAAWDAGWQSLCSTGEGAASVSIPASERALEFNALASIDRGDYITARSLLQRLVDEGLAGEVPNALAYKAALDLDWTEAVRAYQLQPTPRHGRWWGTVFYLAAQQRMFDGALEEADALYRRADAAYGVRGPYLGLGLMECLVQQGRPLEAWDAYRRALVVMPPDEALAHLSRFSGLRLEGLRAWYERQPENEQVSDWLAFYEKEPQRESAGPVVLDDEPTPQVPLELDLGESRMLLGFDYRVEDLETGPFMVVDFYVREGQGEQIELWRMRQTVLNQASNGAFAWDAAPDGVRPVGWHAYLYEKEPAAIEYRDISGQARWLCMDGGAIEAAFGLQSELSAVNPETPVYVQGGDAYVSGEGGLAHGRRWFGIQDTPYPYSYLGGSRPQNEVEHMAGVWIPDEAVDAVAVWLFSGKVGRACAGHVYLFSIPDLGSAG